MRQRSDKDNEEKDPSCRARRGLRRLMFREDYVEDKLILELKKHTGVCPTYIVRSLYERECRGSPSSSKKGYVFVLALKNP